MTAGAATRQTVGADRPLRDAEIGARIREALFAGAVVEVGHLQQLLEDAGRGARYRAASVRIGARLAAKSKQDKEKRVRRVKSLLQADEVKGGVADCHQATRIWRRWAETRVDEELPRPTRRTVKNILDELHSVSTSV